MNGLSLPAILACTATICLAAEDSGLTDKTLVVWVSPADLSPSGGSALTVNDTTIDRFDGTAFAP